MYCNPEKRNNLSSLHNLNNLSPITLITLGAAAVPKIIAMAQSRGVKLHFPVDYVVADKFSRDAK